MPLNEMHNRWIERAMRKRSKLTDWEIEFLRTVAGVEELSDAQVAKLNEIMHKVEFGG